MRKFIGVPRQGHDRLRDAGHLRRPLRANHRAKAGLAQRRHRQGQDQGRLHRRPRPTRRDPASTSAARRRTRSSSTAPRTPTTSWSCSSSSRCCSPASTPRRCTRIYIDKPMRGAALMQALARVNRTFRNKQDGLLVGYAPLTENLYEALAEYTARDQTTKPIGRDIDDAVAKVQDLLDMIGDEILAGYDWRAQRAAKVAAGAPQRGPRRGRTTCATRPTPATRSTKASRPSPSGSARRPPSSPGCTRSARAAATSPPSETTSRSSRRSGSGWPSSTPRSAGPAASRSPRTSSCT